MDIPAYTPYDQQVRHRAIESVLTLSAEILQVTDVTRRLGHYASALTTVIDRATIPNIRNNEIILDGCRSDCVPIVAVHTGEHILRRAKDLPFNASQKYVINKTHKSGLARDIFKYQERLYQDGPDTVEVPALSSDRTIARVHVDYIENDDGPEPVRLYSRPLVQFNLSASQPLSPIVALHEFTHVIQVNSKPIQPARRSQLPVELEAYHVAAQIVRGYHDAGRQNELLYHTSQDNQDTAINVDEIRHNHNGPITDPRAFAYSRELAEDLALNNLTITPAIEALASAATRTTI